MTAPEHLHHPLLADVRELIDAARQLQERINSLLFERTAISKRPEETMLQDLDILRDQGRLSPDLTFRDPYVLDFVSAIRHCERSAAIHARTATAHLPALLRPTCCAPKRLAE